MISLLQTVKITWHGVP